MICKDCNKNCVYDMQCQICTDRWIRRQDKPRLELKAAGTVLGFKHWAWSEETIKWAKSKNE